MITLWATHEADRAIQVRTEVPMLEGTTENAAVGSESASASTGNITSGTASAAMIKAATAASSADAAPVSKPPTGDTPQPDGASGSVAKPDATGQPEKVGQADDATANRGEAPAARIENAVKNTRAATQAEVMRTYGLEGSTPDDVKVALELLADIRRDSRSFHTRLGAELGPADGKPEKEEAEESYPEADLVSPDGKLKTYSHETVLKMLDIHGRKIEKRLAGTFKPVMDFVDGEKTARSEAETRQHVANLVSSTMTEARKLPHWTKENEPKIASRMAAIPVETKRAIGPVAAMHMAYNQFLAEEVFPGIEAAADKRSRDTYAKKANASIGAHPTESGGEGQPAKLENVSQLAAHMARKAAQAEAGT